jgi:hypothetical protein
MADETSMVRLPTKLLEEYRSKHPELKGLTYTAIAEVMLRKALEKEAK